VQHAFEQPALHRIVIDNKNGHGRGLVGAIVPFRSTLGDEA